MQCPKPIILPKNVLAPNPSNLSQAMQRSQMLKSRTYSSVKNVFITGPQGSDGNQGLSPPGPTGPQGYTGEIGAEGNTSNGSSGKTGAMGKPGIGADGETVIGEEGVVGIPSMDKGPVGMIGPQGYIGAISYGAQGDIGATGPIGGNPLTPTILKVKDVIVSYITGTPSNIFTTDPFPKGYWYYQINTNKKIYDDNLDNFSIVYILNEISAYPPQNTVINGVTVDGRSNYESPYVGLPYGTYFDIPSYGFFYSDGTVYIKNDVCVKLCRWDHTTPEILTQFVEKSIDITYDYQFISFS